MMGPCAKTRVICTIVTPDGQQFVGKNWCANPQSVCPRKPDEDYTKCKTICGQEGHAEIVALRLAGSLSVGACAFVEGHDYACRKCQLALFGAGIKSLTIGEYR